MPAPSNRPAEDTAALLGGKAASDWMAQPAVRRRMLQPPWRQALARGAMREVSRE
jgi:hypothetical protein